MLPDNLLLPGPISPFKIRPEDVEAVHASRGFQILRSYLVANQETSFCDEHMDNSEEDQDECLLHRDIVHALVMPVVQLFQRASSLARAALCSDKPDDWELAFRDDARDAFLGLQCFLEDEEEWLHTRGCPACVVATSMATESHIRFLIAAILLAESMEEPAPGALSLPSLSFFLSSIRSAILADSMWSDACGLSEHLYVQAERLKKGMQSIIVQCGELSSLVESPEHSPVRGPARTKLTSVLEEGDSINVCPSRLAKRQARLRQEEQAYLQRLAHQCWGAVALPKDLRMTLKSGIPLNRTRSYTCPV